MRVIQLLNVDGEQAGLYVTSRPDAFTVLEEEITEAFREALKKSEESGEEVHDIADELLEAKGISRTFSDDVSTEVI